MRFPGPNDLAEVRSRSASEFARWLKVGLIEYLFEKAGRYAFPGAEHFIEQHDDITEDLAQIGKALGARDLEALREACAITLGELEFNDDRETILAQELLRLGAKIRAVGMLPILAGKSFRLHPDGRSARLYDIAFEYARDLADLSKPSAADCLRHLIDPSRGFRAALSGQALLALTEADPAGFENHYEDLRPYLDERFGYSAETKEEARKAVERRRLVGALIDRLPYQELLLYPFRPSGGSRPEVTNWWFDTLRTAFPHTYTRLRSLPAASHQRERHVETVRETVAPWTFERAGQTEIDWQVKQAFGDTRSTIPTDIGQHAGS